MDIEQRLATFLKLEPKVQLDTWKELLSIGQDFLYMNVSDPILSKKIATAMLYHRSLMGSSKAYESATEIDVDFCEISLKIARIAFGKTKPLLDYLKSALYYAQFRPERFNKIILENDINEILQNKASN